jgi:hypothetical protein
VFATGDCCDVRAAVLCFQKHFALAFPGMQCIAYGVGVSGLPRLSSVEVCLHVASPATLCPPAEAAGVRLCRALNSSQVQLIVAFIRDGDDAVAGVRSALALLADISGSCDVACTAWVTGPLQQQMAAVLDADAVHNWGVLCAHSLCGSEASEGASGYSAVLSISRHTASAQGDGAHKQ